MLHQTLVSLQPFSTTSFSSPSSLPSPSVTASRFPFAAGRMGSPLSPQTRSSQVEMKDMSLSSEVEDLAWTEDKGNILAEDFVVDDLLDLRGLPESEEDGEVPRVMEDSFTSLEPFPCEENEPLELYSDITLHETDAAQLEWLSRFYDECSEFPSSPPPPPSCCPMSPQKNHLFKHSSSTLSTEALVPIKAKRSKRLRGSGVVWSRSSSLKLTTDSSPVSSITTFTATSPTPSSSSSSSSSSSFNSYISYDPSPFSIFLVDESLPPKPKKRGRKPKNTFLSPTERRCTHCGVHKTPQWRAGPHGAKTLCNACGVRFKSGRLLPEYRPACSPTFVSNIHSNSHRKVLEMRRKKDEHIFLVPSARPVSSC